MPVTGSEAYVFGPGHRSRLAAPRLLAERGRGVTPITEPNESDDTLLRVSQAEVDAAVSTFKAKVLALAAQRERPAVSVHDRDHDAQVEQRVAAPDPSERIAR